MRIGIDCDGVICNFYTAYEALTREVSGRDLFPSLDITVGPPVWNWPEYYGYTAEEMKEVWRRIKTDPEFWFCLSALPDFTLLRERWSTLSYHHDVYFVTDRPGINTKRQTEAWFKRHGIDCPTMLISAHKGLVARALSLDVYVDDKLENIVNVVEEAPTCRSFLVDRAYNHTNLHTNLQFDRVKDFQEVLDFIDSKEMGR